MDLEEYRQINSGDMEWKKNVDNQELYHLIFAFLLMVLLPERSVFMNKLLTHPAAAFALIGVLTLILGGLYFRHVHLSTRTLVNMSLMLAITVVLHQIKLFHMPQGGSVTAGSMVPLLLIAYRYGAGIGSLAGFLYGLIDLLLNPFIVHPVQVLFDYPLPYMAMGLAGLWSKHLYVGTALAFIGRFFCHFISGIVFFASYAPSGMSPVLYSMAFIASYLLPEFIICCLILKLLPLRLIMRSMKS